MKSKSEIQTTTPGKWQSAETVSGKLLIVADTEPWYQQVIAELKGKTANIRKDAMLIRAAPDLLALVSKLALCDDGRDVSRGLCDEARELVKRIVGSIK